MLLVGVQKVWVHLQSALEVESFDLQHAVDGDLRLLAALDGSELVDRADAALNAGEILLCHEIDLVQQDAVGECQLLLCLILGALRLLLVEVLLDVLGVDERDDAIEHAE